jgi:hypothetical protein
MIRGSIEDPSKGANTRRVPCYSPAYSTINHGPFWGKTRSRIAYSRRRGPPAAAIWEVTSAGGSCISKFYIPNPNPPLEQTREAPYSRTFLRASGAYFSFLVGKLCGNGNGN